MDKFKKFYICPKSDSCNNKSCFMRQPHGKSAYYRLLKDTCSLKDCITVFNKLFSCNDEKLELQEFSYIQKV